MIDIQMILKQNAKRLEGNFFSKSLNTISLVEYCVDRSTIRSFHSKKGHTKKYKPLSIFRVWCFNYLNDKKIIDTSYQKDDFKSLRNDALNSLNNFWIENDGGCPEFYQFNKLIDLFFKSLPLWDMINTEMKAWLYNSVHSPLDKFSLDLLRQCKKELNIPINASMNYITALNYNKLQLEIKNLCNGFPNILFDLYAWNENHKAKIAFELIPLDRKKR